jgi:nucleoside-diphosphate-sugar epimerase
VTILRPGAVFGPGRVGITGRVGIDTFGVFLHLGGSNRIPFTFVDNCADAIALGGLVPHDPGEVFNVVDDDIPTSREFLRLYKKRVRRFTSLFVPYSIAHALCHLWEWYSGFSRGQLPPVFNRARARTEWAGTRYSNRKLKEVLGWRPRIPMSAALDLYLDYQRQAGASPAARDA